MKTSELEGDALDWAVAQAEGNAQLQYDRTGHIYNLARTLWVELGIDQ